MTETTSSTHEQMQVAASIERITMAHIDALRDVVDKLQSNASLERAIGILDRTAITSSVLTRLIPATASDSAIGRDTGASRNGVPPKPARVA